MLAFTANNRQAMADQGFTLVEVLIAMLMGGIVLAAVMASFHVQHKTYLNQDEVVAMQQNARLAMDLLTQEIRQAGYDPTGNAGAGIVTATAGRLGFTQDINEDGDTADANEALTYGFSNANDGNQDGIADTGNAPLGRNSGTATGVGGSGFQRIAEDFQAVEFYYLLDDGTRTLTPADLTKIRGIQVSLLARTAVADPNYTDSNTYTAASGATFGSPFNDGFRRQLLTQTVICRNLGL